MQIVIKTAVHSTPSMLPVNVIVDFLFSEKHVLAFIIDKTKAITRELNLATIIEQRNMTAEADLDDKGSE